MPTDKTELTYDVFISYAGPDGDAAKALCEKLEQQGLSCWIAPRNVRAGHKYLEEILEGVIRSKCLLLLLSENTQHAEYVENEVERAKSYRRKIYTLRLEEVPIPKNLELILGVTQWIDSWASDYPERLQQVVANVKQTNEPNLTPITTSPMQKLFRTLRKNALGIATVGILLFFVVTFFSGTFRPSGMTGTSGLSSTGMNQMPSPVDSISDLVAEDFKIKIHHSSYGDKYQIQFVPNGAGLTLSSNLTAKQYYYNLVFDNGTSVREISGLLGAQFDIPHFDEAPENVELTLEDVDAGKSAALNYPMTQLPELIKIIQKKRFAKLTSDFNKRGAIYCSYVNALYARVKVCHFGSIGQDTKYNALLDYIKFISYGEQQDALTNSVNLQTLETQGVAGYKLDDSRGKFEFFVPMTQEKIYYQAEYIDGEKSPVFSLQLSSNNDGKTIYPIDLPSANAIPLFLLDWSPSSPLMLVAAANSDVAALDWQIYPSINNAFTPIGTWYHSLLADGLNSQETVKLIATYKNGSVSEYEYSLKLKSKLTDQRLAKNKLQVKNLFHCDSSNCYFAWMQATQEDVDTVDDILIGLKSDRLVSITHGDLGSLSKDAESQRLSMLANEEAKMAKQPKPKPLSFGTPVNGSGAPSLLDRLRIPAKFQVRQNWKIRETTRNSRFISYSLPISPLFIQFKWKDGSYSKIMVIRIANTQ